MGTGIGTLMPIMPTLTRALERARRLAGRGEDRGAVAVRVGVDQVDRGVQRRYPHHAQHGPEDLVGVDRHVGGDGVEQRRPDEEAVLVTVDDQARGRRRRRSRRRTRPASM